MSTPDNSSEKAGPAQSLAEALPPVPNHLPLPGPPPMPDGEWVTRTPAGELPEDLIEAMLDAFSPPDSEPPKG